MPKHRVYKESSTTRRLRLADSIDYSGFIMVRSCENCRRAGRVCKVHLRSGRCNECNRHNLSGCDVRVTASEWSRLRSQREDLLKRIADARLASTAAMEREAEQIRLAREATSTALAKEQRLARQLHLLDSRVDEAVATQERSVQDLEFEELLADLPAGGLHLGSEAALLPSTWDSLSAPGSGLIGVDLSSGGPSMGIGADATS